MIITILPSSANFHAIAYNEMKVEKGVATLLEAQNILGLRQDIALPSPEDKDCKVYNKDLLDHNKSITILGPAAMN